MSFAEPQKVILSAKCHQDVSVKIRLYWSRVDPLFKTTERKFFQEETQRRPETASEHHRRAEAEIAVMQPHATGGTDCWAPPEPRISPGPRKQDPAATFTSNFWPPKL